VRTVAIGGTYLDPAVGGKVLAAAEDSQTRLTDREREVLGLIALGHTNAEIAEQLFLSRRTIETHRANIQRKLNLSTRAELTRHALEQGLFAA
jgi:two-component system, NarL family, response regulator NreC